jgi:hypothetical protein
MQMERWTGKREESKELRFAILQMRLKVSTQGYNKILKVKILYLTECDDSNNVL